jgi:hypothetical protein
MSFFSENADNQTMNFVNGTLTDRRNTFHKQMRQDQMSQLVSQRRNFDFTQNNDKFSTNSIPVSECDTSSQKSWPMLWSPESSVVLSNDGENSNGQQWQEQVETTRKRKSTIFDISSN